MAFFFFFCCLEAAAFPCASNNLWELFIREGKRYCKSILRMKNTTLGGNKTLSELAAVARGVGERCPARGTSELLLEQLGRGGSLPGQGCAGTSPGCAERGLRSLLLGPVLTAPWERQPQSVPRWDEGEEGVGARGGGEAEGWELGERRGLAIGEARRVPGFVGDEFKGGGRGGGYGAGD